MCLVCMNRLACTGSERLPGRHSIEHELGGGGGAEQEYLPASETIAAMVLGGGDVSLALFW